MKKLLSILLIISVISGCDQLGSTKIKNLIDLTPKLEIENNAALKITEGKKDPYSQEKQKSYNIAKAPIISAPAIAKKIVYSIDKKGYASAFSINEQKTLWTADITGGSRNRNFYSGAVLYSNGKLFITNGTRYLIILDAVNGREIIRKEFPDILRTKPVMAGSDLIIVQTLSNQLISYNINDSKFVWIHEGGIETISAKAHVHPVLYEDSVIASYSSGEVVSVDIKSGQEKWRYSLLNFSDVALPGFEPAVITTEPIISGDNAYFATSTGKVIKLNLSSGTPVWSREAEDVQSMAFHQGILLITNNARQVAAIGAVDGRVSWIGDLISEKERNKRKPKPALFQSPFVSVEGSGFAVNVIASNGDIYKFITDENGNLPRAPMVIPIDKGVRYYWLSCCTGKIHLITEQSIKF